MGDLLAVAVGLDDGWLDGVGDELGAVDGAAAGEGVAVGESVDVPGTAAAELLADAAFATRSAAGAATAIITPATIATMPPMAPAANARIVQVDVA